MNDTKCKNCGLLPYMHAISPAYRMGGWTFLTEERMVKQHGPDVKKCKGYKPVDERFGFRVGP